MKSCLLLLGFAVSFNLTAEENFNQDLSSLKEKISQAIVKVENTQRDLWSYDISRFEDEEGDISSSIEQYSPLAAEKWVLKKINGQTPTKKQIKKFAKRKQKESNNKHHERSFQVKLRELIDRKSLSLVTANESNIVMAFDVSLKKLGEDSNGKLKGQLVYKKDEQFIEKISIWNNADFSPMLTAIITDLAITFIFIQVDGSVLSKKNEMKMKGSFAYFAEINETSLDVYSDYQYQGK